LFFVSSAAHRGCHSFPTRRSSDLAVACFGRFALLAVVIFPCAAACFGARRVVPARSPVGSSCALGSVALEAFVGWPAIVGGTFVESSDYVPQNVTCDHCSSPGGVARSIKLISS